MKRWTRRILIGLVVLVVVVLVTTQIVLWTDYPRRLVLGLVQQQLGLRVEARSLGTGWFGATTLKDVEVSLPLAEESFLSMPTMEVDHTSLLPLAITRNFELQGIKLIKPIVVVRRDANGRWNLQDVLELLGKAGGGNPEPGTKTKPPKLPRLRVIDGTITVVEHNGDKAIIEPLQVSGDPQGPLVYKYDAAVPQHLEATGQVAPGENWKHEVELFADPPASWMEPWVKEPPSPLMAKVRWAGTLNNGRIVGRLTIDQAKYDEFAARGMVVAQGGGEGPVVLNPQELIISTNTSAIPELQLSSGALQIDGPVVRLKQVRISALGGTAQVDGSGDLAARHADLVAAWDELPAPGKIQHSGSLDLKLQTPFPGGPEVTATLRTRGTAPQGPWNGAVHINGSGKSWADMNWVVKADRLAWQGKAPFTVDDFTAKITQRGNEIRLASVAWPGHQVSASGKFDLQSNDWSFRLNGRETVTAMGTPGGRTPLAFGIDARGDAERIQLNHLLLSAQELDIKITGAYVFREPMPVKLHFNAVHVPRPPSGTDRPPVRGRVVVEGRLEGTADPIDLKVNGKLQARNLNVLGRDYGDIRGTIGGALTATSAEFAVSDMKLLGGDWGMTAAWPYRGDDRLVDDTSPMRAKVVVKNLSLTEIGALLETPLDGGPAGGEWTIDLPFPGAKANTIAMVGTFRAADVVVDEEQLKIDEIVASMSLHDGIFSADPITLRRKEQDVSGSATVVVQANASDPMRPLITVDASTWPIRLAPDAMAAVTAEAKLTIDGKEKSASGPIQARATFATTQHALGEASIEGEVDGAVIVLDRIALDAIGGSAHGSGAIDTAVPNRSTLTMSWSGIEGTRLSDLIPQLEGLGGSYSGALTLAPATAQRALEPLRMTLGVTPQGGRFGGAEIGPMRFSAFLDLQPGFSVQRIVLDALPSEIRDAQKRAATLDSQDVPLARRPLDWNEIRVADGRVRVWGRRGQHRGADAVQTHLIVDFTRLDIDQLARAAQPNSEPMPGRVSGSMTIHGDPENPNRVFGRGNVEITESDLGNVDALALLYNATQIGQSTTQPTGSGSLDISLQASTLSLQNIRYFNRGVAARSSSIDISDIWQLPKSPILGFIVGSARPLKDMKLPLLADVDQILDVVQSGLTTVKIEGTIEDHKVSLATFGEVSDALKRFIVGEVKSETRK